MARSLDHYASKRSFKRTPEPAPRLVARTGPLLFVVQKHAARRLHYDFRLELDGVLKSWAVPKGPSLQLGEKRLAVETEDHPFDYASFEGVIPEKEYGAGKVIVWDCGIYSPDEGQRYSFADRAGAEQRLREELANGKVSFFLCGEKLKGSFALVRTSDPKQWLLLKHKDRFASSEDVLVRSESVITGSTLESSTVASTWTRAEGRARAASSEHIEAARLAPEGPAEALPKKLSPMLAEIGDSMPSDGNWLYEPKLDGYRVIAFVDHGTVRLISRRGIDYTRAFPEIVTELAAQVGGTMILDAEIVALDGDGRPSFNALQNRAQKKTVVELAEAQRLSPVVLVCFDLLHFAGMNLRDVPYIDRRRYLTQCLLPSKHLQLTHISSDAQALYEASLASGFEGIVAKRKDSRYLPGKRSATWLKVKAIQTADFVVGGYTKGKGARDPLGALLLGYWSGRKLIYAGHVGSGLNDTLVAEFRKRFEELTRKTSPFAEKPPLHRPTTWLDPKLVIEVSFADWTPEGLLRAPVFLRERDDLAPRSITSKQLKATRGAKGAGKKGAGAAKEAGQAGSGRASAAASAAEVSASRHTAPTKRARPSPTPTDEIGEVLQQLESDARQFTLRIGQTKLPLSSLDRVYWPADPRFRQPAITKRDLIRYLVAVSPHMLPHLRDRPVTMIRMPEGIDGERFFQKHWDHPTPDYIEKVTVFSGHKDERHEYLLANNLPALLWMGQHGALEFHVWHSRLTPGPDSLSQSSDYSGSLETLEASVANYPDYLVFDIDPYIYSGQEAKGAEPELNKKGYAVGRRVAFWLRDLLQLMSLQAVVKTSGKTGLHVFVPIERIVTFDEAREICEKTGRHVMQAHPREITMEWSVVRRTGKIFIDYNMNVRGKTLNVAYSPRGVPGAPVSMPLTWEELETAEPLDFRVGNVLGRLEKTGDRWHDIFSSKQSLTRAFDSAGRKSQKP